MSTQESKDYARGYAAGRKRQEVDVDREKRQQRENENWNRAFLAALPGCMNDLNWTDGNGKKLTSVVDRTWLATRFADEAMKHMRSNVP